MDRPGNSNLGATDTIGGDGTDAQTNASTDTRPISKIVAQRIRDAIKPGPEFDEKPEAFVLECDLRRILTRETVQLVLDRILYKYPDRTVSLDAIFNNTKGTGRLRILATLLYIGRTKALHEFVTFNIWDNALPLSKSSAPFIDLKDLWLKGFVQDQYMFLPQVIDFECMKHKKLRDPIRMPFLNPLVDPEEGAHGVVSKVRIHEDYQRWGWRTRCKDHYAVKLFKADAVTFQQERDALLRFSHPNKGHESLIQLLYSYELRSNKYLIFPCAEWDLENHWANHEADPRSQADLIWMLQECYGIASGLYKVHNHTSWKVGARESGSQNKGRHGDIKPKNILFFRDEESSTGRLVVADFTLMRFHSSIDTEYTRIRNVGYSRTYRPPEMDASGTTQVSQKYDIWTLGCVFLEFITWHLLGPDAVRPSKEGCGRGFVAPDGQVREDFGTSRLRDDNTVVPHDKFFNLCHDTPPIVKPSVLNWIDYLRDHECCSQALVCFLNLIKDHMLIAKPEDRCSMFRVTTTMGEILTTARSSPAYCQPLQRRSPASEHNLPNLLGSSESYRCSVILPKLQPSKAIAPQGSEYDLFESAMLSSHPPAESEKVEGGLRVLRDESSIGRASNSFITSSSMIHRESVDGAGSAIGSFTPATTRQPSERGRASYDSRRATLAEAGDRSGEMADLGISEGSFEKHREVNNVVVGSEIPQVITRREVMKICIKNWKCKIKLRLQRMMRGRTR